MDTLYIGAYWKNRQQTLREYADASRGFLALLQGIHPLFRSMEFVGQRPNSAVKLAADLSNLDELIYHYAGSKRALHSAPNADGTPSWESTSPIGYAMTYATEISAASPRVSVGIATGVSGDLLSSAMTIQFPPPEKMFAFRDELLDDAFLKDLFIRTNAYWRPDESLLTSHDFSKAVGGRSLPYVGWMTFIGDKRALALRNCDSLGDIAIENVETGGVLISLHGAPFSPEDREQIEQAQRLRAKLLAEHLINP